MAGVPGAGGPVPKRDQRRQDDRSGQPDKVYATGRVQAPKLKGKHSAVGRRFYEALQESAQSEYFEPSDWAAAELVVETIDAFVAEPTAALMRVVQQGMTGLLVTEGDRRRMKMEIERAQAEDPESVAAKAEVEKFIEELQDG